MEEFDLFGGALHISREDPYSRKVDPRVLEKLGDQYFLASLSKETSEQYAGALCVCRTGGDRIMASTLVSRLLRHKVEAKVFSDAKVIRLSPLQMAQIPVDNPFIGLLEALEEGIKRFQE